MKPFICSCKTEDRLVCMCSVKKSLNSSSSSNQTPQGCRPDTDPHFPSRNLPSVSFLIVHMYLFQEKLKWLDTDTEKQRCLIDSVLCLYRWWNAVTAELLSIIQSSCNSIKDTREWRLKVGTNPTIHHWESSHGIQVSAVWGRMCACSS